MSHSEKIKTALEQLLANGHVDPELYQVLDKDDKDLLAQLFDKNLVEESLKLLQSLEVDEDWKLVKKRLEPVKSIRRSNTSLLKYAALFIGLIGLSYFIWINSASTSVVSEINTENEITLKLGNQETKVIVQGDTQSLVSSDGVILGTQQGNTLVYDQNAKVEDLVYSELTVPYGKTFNISLSDGTVVHLNAGSSIKYPVKFVRNKNREVFLKGEAYFKVTRNTESPFIVNANEVAVEVLGTEFNVSSYDEDLDINTVLVEGSVQLSSANNPEEKIMLSPGFKGAFNKSEQTIATEKVDLELYVGWIKGEMVFRKSSFDNLLKKIERRYNVTIINRNKNLNEKKFNARFDVNIESIEDVMKSISGVTPFEYVIQGDTIIIN